MSSGLREYVTRQDVDASSRWAHWARATEAGSEPSPWEGSGLLWQAQAEMPSRRWYVEAYRDPQR